MESSRDETKNQFGCKGYPYSIVIDSGPNRHRFLKFLFGPVDLFITCLYGQTDLAFKTGLEYFCSEAPRILTGLFKPKRWQIIFPVRGKEELYWEDALALFTRPEQPEMIGHEWSKDRIFLILTSIPPRVFNSSKLPLVSIDITDIEPYEMRLLIISLGRLCSRNRIIPFGMAGSFGKPLFRQKLSLLPGADQKPRRESALDILSLPALVIPTMTVDFKYFQREVPDRFDSICEETLSSREGALPYSKIIEMRREMKEYFRIPPRLMGEEEVRDIWN